MQGDLQVVQQMWFARGGCATLYKAFLHADTSEDRKSVCQFAPQDRQAKVH